ncbi:MAG: antibiotic biosynthesis monooxygenase [Candidatus Thiodiazotropha sp. (ex Monitilora ramsayi)]|nr:antibiotic biosynthesis monooxygenase [Candidatus Thiodiazotropha sp. (ex Monitilora ramsayi)]
MYAVIFKARIRSLDEDYQETANKLREIAMKEFGCREFVSVSEGEFEISISYWDDMNMIRAWKESTEHLKAQTEGRNRWYHSIQIQVVEVVREYERNYASA